MRLSKWGQWVVVVFLGIALLLAGACGGGEAGNTHPQISSLTATPPGVGVGGSSTAVCVATDPDGDTLSYDWTATKGTFTGSGDTVTWMAPNEEGTYTIRVTVSDGKGGTVEESVSVAVGVSLGSINVTSIPEGANVYLDGEDTGKATPCAIGDLAPGSYTLKITYDHYKYQEGTVTVGAEPVTYVDWTLDYAVETTHTMQPGAGDRNDAFVYEDSKDQNYGSEWFLRAGGAIIDEHYRTYVEFDLSPIPTAATIVDANLVLFYFETSPEVPTLLGAYQVKSDWEENHINWANQPSCAPEPESTVNVPAAAAQEFESWDISALVQSWVDGSIVNKGVCVMDTDEGTVKAWKSFYSSHHTEISRRPKLVITYFDTAP